jgi:hypothetical protein
MGQEIVLAILQHMHINEAHGSAHRKFRNRKDKDAANESSNREDDENE